MEIVATVFMGFKNTNYFSFIIHPSDEGIFWQDMNMTFGKQLEITWFDIL